MQWTARIDDADYIAPDLDTLRSWYEAARLQPHHLVFHPTLQRWMYARDVAELATVRAGAKRPSSRVDRYAFGGCGLVLLVVAAWFVVAVAKNVTHPTATAAPASATPVADDPNAVTLANGQKFDRKDVDEQFATLQKIHLIRSYSFARNEAQVNGAAWRLLDLNTKRGAVLYTAAYFKAHNGFAVVNLIDSRTGEKLASFDSWSGVKMAGEE